MDKKQLEEMEDSGHDKCVPEVSKPHKVQYYTTQFVVALDFYSTKQGLSLVNSWSRGLD